MRCGARGGPRWGDEGSEYTRQDGMREWISLEVRGRERIGE